LRRISTTLDRLFPHVVAYSRHPSKERAHVQMNRVAWEMKRWGLVLINSTFDLTRLILFGLILS
jgi:hypothetical protein